MFLKFLRSFFTTETMVKNQRCRGEYYPRENNVKRIHVEDREVPWNVDIEYKPTDFTAEKIIKNSGTKTDPMDVKDLKFKVKTNDMDRTSEHDYLVKEGFPLNPMGRTGLKGRGILYYWGPNHAADPVVTTWKRDSDGKKELDKKTKKPILQFVAIFRKHDKEWALPGGMVDPGEEVTTTVKREFSEEALNAMELAKEDRDILTKKIDKLFHSGKVIYKGYVDDPRNTDNAWMETVAINFHDERGDSLAKVKLTAGDDASAVKWVDLSSSLSLYASHSEILQKVAVNHKAHW